MVTKPFKFVQIDCIEEVIMVTYYESHFGTPALTVKHGYDNVYRWEDAIEKIKKWMNNHADQVIV